MITRANSHWRLARTLLIVMAIFIFGIGPIFVHPVAIAQGGTTHTVQAGENLFRIALRYNMTVEYLASANGITDPTRIYAGQVLTIPDPTAPQPAAPPVEVAPAFAASNPAPASNTTPIYHTVQPGETLASIGRTYGTTWPELAAANGLANANQIFSGQQILIPGTNTTGAAATAPAVNPAPAAATTDPIAPASSGERIHVVVAGQHLAEIARTYGISWPTIARANNIADPNHIYAGQTLIIPATDDAQGTYSSPSFGPSAAPPPTITTGKQIIVDVSDQRTYAYENGQLVRNVAVSTGVPAYPTVQGDYRVYLKYTSQTMSGPGYYLPGVPYVMYFYKGYSLHGTYWHSNFGQPMSHGCVNMPTPEAEWLFNWSEIGTPVRVQY